MRTETEELTAGPELDAAVHVALGKVGSKWTGYTVIHDEPIWMDDTGNPVTCPHYSRDIRAAWRLQDVIPMTVYAPHASHADGEYENGERWGAEAVSPLCGPGNPYAAITAAGETAPEAMCRCALLWSEARSRPQSKP